MTVAEQTPDFEQIARTFSDRWQFDALTDATEPLITDLAEQLRLVWNARGEADIAAIDALDRIDLEAELSAMLTSSQHAVRGLDR